MVLTRGMDRIHPLKAYRENHDPPLSQQDLADLVAVDRVTVTRWESGARKIDEKKLPTVVECTGIAAAVLRPDLAHLFAGVARPRRAPARVKRSRAA
jgi:DNA-binding XRE family transcriptional regulator